MSDVLALLSYVWVAPWRDSLASVLWCLWLSVVLATVYAWWRRMTLGRAILALQKAGADSEENAKTPGELGLKGFAARALHGRDHLIKKEGEGYYLPEEAALKAKAVTKVAPVAWWWIPLAAVIAYTLLVAAWYVVPLFD